MRRTNDNRAVATERFFAELCAERRLRGFVFHSPKVTNNPNGTSEAGDVVIWVRDLVIVFEVIWKNVEISNNTRRFVQRIGHKRGQLIRDREVYESEDNEISMTNQDGETILFDHEYFNDAAFCGIVIVDSELPLEKLHFQTIRKSLTANFPLAVMTTRDFRDLLVEVDTPSDLHYYLADRTRFLKEVFEADAGIFLDLNRRTERELIGFYKIHDNSFSVDSWNQSADKRFWHEYETSFAEQIASRNQENDESFIIDEVIELVRKENRPGLSTLPHSDIDAYNYFKALRNRFAGYVECVSDRLAVRLEDYQRGLDPVVAKFYDDPRNRKNYRLMQDELCDLRLAERENLGMQLHRLREKVGSSKDKECMTYGAVFLDSKPDFVYVVMSARGVDRMELIKRATLLLGGAMTQYKKQRGMAIADRDGKSFEVQLRVGGPPESVGKQLAEMYFANLRITDIVCS